MCLSDDYGWIVLNCLGNYKFVYNRALAELCKLCFVNLCFDQMKLGNHVNDNALAYV